MNGLIYFRADHDLVGRVLAIKERQRLTPPADSSFRITESLDALDRRRVAAGVVG